MHRWRRRSRRTQPTRSGELREQDEGACSDVRRLGSNQQVEPRYRSRLGRAPTLGSVHEEIRQLAARYAFYTDAKDIDALVELYVPDVRISSTLAGRETLHRLMTEALRGVGITFLNIGTHMIEPDPHDVDCATGVVYCKAEIQDGGPDSDRWIHQAIQYHDVYERRDGRWYFGANRKHFLVYGAEIGENPLTLGNADWPTKQTRTTIKFIALRSENSH